MSDESLEARHAAIRLLARREHSRHELRQKLVQRGHGSDLIDEQLERLVEEGLLSDERFAEAYVRMRGQRGYGPQRISAELRERGVADSLITEALRHDDTDWYALAVTVRRKRFGDELPEDYKERARQMRFLQYRGFESEQLNGAFSNDDV